ncbi:MAG: antitoxin MazE family protein [Burkholderiales bacterium]|jgi:hypothetical protein
MAATSERVQQHRDRLRRAGLRPIQLWVPDTRRPGFAEECRRQSALLADDPQERDTIEWLQAVADDDGWR